MSLMIWATRAQADEYQDQIAQAFAGFEILTRSDFTEEVQQTVKTNPAIATGHFNRDKLEDFAAIILNRSTQYGQQGERKYYLGKYVVCHGAGKGRYQCQTLKEEHMYLPYALYLRRVKPGKLECVVGKDQTVAKISLKQDGIGWVFIDRGSAVYIYQSDGTYWECGEPSD
jgi:hypothetical protein